MMEINLFEFYLRSISEKSFLSYFGSATREPSRPSLSSLSIRDEFRTTVRHFVSAPQLRRGAKTNDFARRD